MCSILPSYVFLLTIIIILLLTCPISSQLRLKNAIEEKSIKDLKKFKVHTKQIMKSEKEQKNALKRKNRNHYSRTKNWRICYHTR
ncbi:hypothetical protein FOS08_27160 [Bacillus pseudomycoides]|uniref:Uncharacterized protein n=1 Tax=Bacillus pseudomycoides TaxID=64104 RepID=A0AAJ2DMJ9_9BACI|nr:hypothetical protein [Bacillus pseudomycoides]